VPALAVVQVSQSLIRVIGPALGALLVATAGPSRTFWVQTVCFAVSAGLIWRLRLATGRRPAVASDAVAPSRVEELFAGVRVVWTNRVVRGITAAEILWQVIGTMFVVGLVVYTEETIALGDRAETVFALLMATIAGARRSGRWWGTGWSPGSVVVACWRSATSGRSSCCRSGWCLPCRSSSAAGLPWGSPMPGR